MARKAAITLNTVSWKRLAKHESAFANPLTEMSRAPIIAGVRYALWPPPKPISVEKTMSSLHHCPACGREFKHILDYPRVRILTFERLPIPEAVDCWSGAAAEKRLSRLRAEQFSPDVPPGGRQDGINITPQIARACDANEVQEYLARLAALRGRVVAPQELLPPFAAQGHFKWAYPVAEAGIYLSLSDSEAPADDTRIAEVQVHCDGPNLGSAGGPTLQPLGAVARLRYEGLLAS